MVYLCFDIVYLYAYPGKRVDPSASQDTDVYLSMTNLICAMSWIITTLNKIQVVHMGWPGEKKGIYVL